MVKKNLLKLLTLIILLTSVITPVFADDYIPSPNKNNFRETKIVGGTIIENGGSYIFITREDGCIDRVVLTPYEYRDSIEDKNAYNQLVKAYEMLENTDDLSKLVPEIKTIANRKGANVKDLAVRYLFDISIYESEKKSTHNEELHNRYYELPVEVENLEDYICLIVYQEGEWKLVEGAYIDPNNPNVLYIPISTGSGAYAIIVANDYTYGIGCIIHWIILGLAVIISIIVILMKNKEDNNKQDNAKLIKLVKILLLIIDVIAVLLLYIFFSNCSLDIIALVINYIACLLAFLLSKKAKDEKKD